MAKDPAFLFYTGDFSTGTQFFTDEQLGKYLRLLMAQHQLGHLQEKHMIMICKSYDNDIFGKFVKDSDGLYFNQRLELEIHKRKNYCLSRGNNKTSKKSKRKSYDNHMEDKDKNKDVTVNKDVKNGIDLNVKKEKPVEPLVYPYDTENFMMAWEVLRGEKKWRSKSQAALQASLNKLSKHPESTAILMIEAAIAGEWQGIHEIQNPFNNGKTGNKNSDQTSLGRLAEQSREFLQRIADENNQG